MLQVGRSRRLEGLGEKHLGGYRKEGVQRAAARRTVTAAEMIEMVLSQFAGRGASELGILGPGVQICHCQAGVREAGCACAWVSLVPMPTVCTYAHWQRRCVLDGPTDAEGADLTHLSPAAADVSRLHMGGSRMRLLCRGAVEGSGHTGDRTGVPTGHWTVKRVVCPATAAQVLRCPPAAAG